MGHSRSQHFMLESRDIEIVTRREGRWGFSLLTLSTHHTPNTHRRMQLQKNAFVDAFNTNPKGIPQIKLNHLGTIFVDKNGYDWKVGFTDKNMTIFCDKCLKLTPRTSYCKPVKDRIIHLQQAAPTQKEKHPPPNKEKHSDPSPPACTDGTRRQRDASHVHLHRRVPRQEEHGVEGRSEWQEGRDPPPQASPPGGLLLLRRRHAEHSLTTSYGAE